MNLEKGNVITLENDKKYLVLDVFIYNNKKYLYIISLTIDHVYYVEVTDSNNDINIKIVKDEKLIKLFAQNYINNYKAERMPLKNFISLFKDHLALAPTIYEFEDEYFNNAINYLNQGEPTNLKQGNFSTTLLQNCVHCDYLESLVLLHHTQKYPEFAQKIASILKK